MARKKFKSAPKKPQRPLTLDAVAQGLVILFVVLVLYIPAMTAGFIWDDDQLLTVNPAIPSPSGLYEFWFAPKTADYFPLTSSTLWLEYRLWGIPMPDSFNGYHVTNIVMHAIAAVLLWRVLLALAIPGAWLAALIFAVHPVCVESVAWVSERKNTLSQIFVFLTLLAYFDFEKTNRQKFYVWAVVLFALALLAKTSVVMVPVVLLLAAWWQFGIPGLFKDKVETEDERKLLRVVNIVVSGVSFVVAAKIGWGFLSQREPVPSEMRLLLGGFLAVGALGLACARLVGIMNRHFARSFAFGMLSALLGVTTIYFQYGRAIGQEVIPIGGFMSRLANAGMAIWFYIGKTFWPLDLLVIYPRWNIQPPALLEFWGCAALVAVFAICWKFRERWGKHVIFGFGYFVLTILPAIGFLKMSYMRLTLVADHFQYLSMVGVIALVVAAATTTYRRSGAQFRPLFIGAAAIVVGGCSWLTWMQASIYRSEETLWANTLRKNSDSWQAHNHYGAVLFQKGIVGKNEKDTSGAMFHFSEAVRLKPENPESHNNLGLAYVTNKRMDEGIAQYREAVRIKGDEPSMRTNLANALGAAKRYDEAITEYREVLKLTPNNPNVRCALGYTLAEVGRLDEAIEQFRKAVKIAPNMPQARQNLEAALRRKQMNSGQ